MRVEMYAIHKKSLDRCRVRALQFSEMGRVTHISTEPSPNTTWERASDFHLLPVTVHLTNEEEK